MYVSPVFLFGGCTALHTITTTPLHGMAWRVLKKKNVIRLPPSAFCILLQFSYSSHCHRYEQFYQFPVVVCVTVLPPPPPCAFWFFCTKPLLTCVQNNRIAFCIIHAIVPILVDSSTSIITPTIIMMTLPELKRLKSV